MDSVEQSGTSGTTRPVYLALGARGLQVLQPEILG